MKKVFISYSHDSNEHSEMVLGLDASLSREGFDCRLDVYKDIDETSGQFSTLMTGQFSMLIDNPRFCMNAYSITISYHLPTHKPIRSLSDREGMRETTGSLAAVFWKNVSAFPLYFKCMRKNTTCAPLISL